MDKITKSIGKEYINHSNFKSLGDYIYKFQNEIDFHDIICCYQVNEEFIQAFEHMIEFGNLSMHQKLSLSFLNKYYYKLHWGNVIRNQKINLSIFNLMILHGNYAFDKWNLLFSERKYPIWFVQFVGIIADIDEPEYYTSWKEIKSPIIKFIRFFI